MAATFARCLAFTLQAEGGWADNPADPGGCTMHGITLPAFQAWQHDPALECDDLRHVSDTQVKMFYYSKFWLPLQASELPLGVDLMIMDAAVNMGISRSVRILQDCLGVVADGAIGPITLAAAVQVEPAALVDALADAQTQFYRGLARFDDFGVGWLHRVAARRAAAIRAQSIS